MLDMLLEKEYNKNYLNDESNDESKEEIYMRNIKRDPGFIKKLKGIRTPEMCRLAVKLDYTTLKYLNMSEQTPELCKWVINQEPNCLADIKKQTLDLCIMAINKSPVTIMFVNDNLIDEVWNSVDEKIKQDD